MNATDFLPYLGKSTDTEEIRQLLTTLGKSSPKVKRGDTDAYVMLSDRGIALVFGATDDVKSNLLVLEDVQLYGRVQEGVAAPYAGPLPLGLEFTDSKQATRKKLGKPVFSNDDLYIDIWDYDNFTLSISYHLKNSCIGVMHLEAPSAPQDD